MQVDQRRKASAEKDFFTEYGEGSRYRIEEVIGKGSYGVVCSAFDAHTGEKVAIKKINDIFEHVSDATRILREIKLLRLLRHPDIVEIKHILLPPSRREFKDIYVVFELMESDLHQVIKANDDLTPEHYQFFLYQLLRGLKYIHTANVFHRDLKPKNILANADCKLKICDFGLARVAFSDTPTAIFWTDYVATRWYRAPELCGSFFSKVIVRIRPPNGEEEEGDLIVQKTSPDCVSVLDHTFTFDSVADVGSTQEALFQLVGIPLVENCLAGFNSSIFAYGQTGSGKTYTMWGPPSALSEGSSLSSERGLTPRVFELLFSRIAEEQSKHSDKQLIYHCCCSFLEIYNEQITDLLDPTQRNLQIREDTKVGVYVDNLTEENVCTMKDVTQLLIKGLANRRTGATSANAESSRSHCVFTCIVKSQSKNTADGFNSLRISRINLVDLAGSERQKLTGAAGERLREAGNINRSLSQLGNLQGQSDC